MPYRDTQAAVIAALADHARPGHSGWQDQYRPGYWDLVGNKSPSSLLSGMQEVCGEAMFVRRHMERMSEIALALLILRHNTAFPSPLFEGSMRWIEMESARLITGMSNNRLRQWCIRESLHPSPDSRKPDGAAKIPMSYIARKTGAHRNTVRDYWERINPWIWRELERAHADLGGRLEEAGLIDLREVA